MIDDFIKELKGFTLYSLIYSKMLFTTIVYLTFNFISLICLFIVAFNLKNISLSILLLIIMVTSYILFSFKIKKVVNNNYPGVKYSHFNFKFLYDIRKKCYKNI